MDQKIHRYMQRIEKIISTPNKHTSPIRPSRSPLRCRTNQLDKYLKYELSAKIINNIIQKYHQQLTIQFFNLIRRSQYRQRQRVYKFVAIERNEIKVDLAISAKILGSVMKQIVKKRYIPFMQFLHIQLNQKKRIQSIEINQTKRNQSHSQRQSLHKNTMSRQSNSKNRQISQWADDQLSSSNQISNTLYFQEKQKMILKALNKSINLKIKRVTEYSFIKIKSYSEIIKIIKSYEKHESSILSQKEKYFEKQTQKIKKQLMKLKEEAKNKQREDSLLKIKKNTQLENNHINVYHFQLNKMANNYVLKYKHRFISSIKGYLRQSFYKRNQLKNGKKYIQISKGMFNITNFSNTLLKKHFKQISIYTCNKKNFIKNMKEAIYILKLFTTKKVLNIQHFFWKQMTHIPFIQKEPAIFVRQNSNIELPLSMNQQSDSIQAKTSVRQEFSSNAMDKLHFYSYVDKIFKLILIISKLLIPMKQAFVKIDLYASYSYRVEQSFKVVTQNTLRQAFYHIKEYRSSVKLQRESNESHPILVIIERIKNEKLVQAFSHIKIMAKQRANQMEIMPFEVGIISLTKQFITERNNYSQQSLDYWSNLKNTIFQYDNLQNFEDKKEKKRSNTTF